MGQVGGQGTLMQIPAGGCLLAVGWAPHPPPAVFREQQVPGDFPWPRGNEDLGFFRCLVSVLTPAEGRSEADRSFCPEDFM